LTEFGLPLGNLEDIKAKDANSSLMLIQKALDGENGAAKNIVALNAGAAGMLLQINGKFTMGNLKSSPLR
jgi:anthranilate phosphoribosyltransferase